MSTKRPADQLMMQIATLRVAGRRAEADTVLAELKRDYPRAEGPETEFALQMMMKHMPRPRA